MITRLEKRLSPVHHFVEHAVTRARMLTNRKCMRLCKFGRVVILGAAQSLSGACQDECARENSAWCDDNVAYTCNKGGGGGHGPGRNYLDKENCSAGGSLRVELPLVCMEPPLSDDVVACGFAEHTCRAAGEVCVGNWLAHCLGYEHPVPVERCADRCEQVSADVARCIVRCNAAVDAPRCFGPNEIFRCVDGFWRHELRPCAASFR